MMNVQKSRKKPEQAVCQICNEQNSKYKCPTCRIAFCSVACSKRHKEAKCVSSSEKLSTPAPFIIKDASVKRNNSAEGTIRDLAAPRRFENDVDESSKLTEEDLKMLEKDEAVLEKLRNPSFMQKLRNIASAENAGDLLRGEMNDPEFEAFCDHILLQAGNRSDAE